MTLSRRKTGTLIIDNEDYEIEKELAKGAVWTVYKAKRAKDDLQVALKAAITGSCRLEIDILSQCKNAENIVQLLAYDKSAKIDTDRYLITELCSCDLTTFLRDLNLENRLPQNCLRVAINQLSRGYFHLYKNGVLHRNLSSKNILVKLCSGKCILKISGFNCAVFVQNGDQSKKHCIVGRVHYMAPEIGLPFSRGQRRTSSYSCKSDLWALGVLCYEMALGKYPFSSSALMDLFTHADKQEHQVQLDLEEGAQQLPCEVKDIIKKLLGKSVQDRLAPENLLVHECLHGIDEHAPMVLEEQILTENEQSLKLYDLQPETMLPSIVRVGDFEFDENDKNILLGRGSYGSVFRAHRTNDHHNFVALKRIHEQDIDISEIETMRTVTHPNLLKLLDAVGIYPYFYIITELCSYDLEAFLDTVYNGKFSCESQARILARHMSSGYMALRTVDILHRDIKPANVLVKIDRGPNESLRASFKLADFGCSKKLTQTAYAQTVLGTPFYMAPEVGACLYLNMETARYDHRADVWSMALIIFRSMTGKSPFDESDLLRLFYDVGVKNMSESSVDSGEHGMNGHDTLCDYKQILHEQMDLFNFSEQLRDFFDQALRADYTRRMSAMDFFQHPFHGHLLSTCRLDISAHCESEML